MIPAIFLWLGINAVQAQTRLSIEDCRRMALENSDDIKISSRKVGKAVSDRQAAKTAYFPKISGSATYAYIFENIDMGMVGMEMSMKGMYMAGITLQQPVYAGGKIVNANKMAKTGVAISEENKRLTRINTLVEVEQTYWMYVSVAEKVKLLTQYTQLLDSLHQQVSSFFELKMATAQDLHKVRTRRSNVTYELQRAGVGCSNNCHRHTYFNSKLQQSIITRYCQSPGIPYTGNASGIEGFGDKKYPCRFFPYSGD